HLRATANLSTGGTAIDRTDDIHPDNAAIARRAALTIGLDIAGIDFIAPDIARSVRETGGGIVEVNAAPGFRMHLEPFEGRPRDVAEAVIRMMFPHGAPSRIPIIAVTGTNGKSTTTRMVAHILRRSGLTVGLTSTNGVYVNDERIAAWDASGPASARMVLRDPTVDAAVLETARGGILREGLAFARCDVGAVLNVQEDHLGVKGVDTIEDLARIKSVVVEAVHRDGCSVLNADDPLAAGMADRAGGRVAFFSLRGGDDMPAFLRRHLEEGGLAVVREPTPDGGELVVHHDERRLPLMRAAAIPATLGGLAEFNVQNALAAIAISFAHGLPPSVIRSALATYESSYEQCPGRLNVFDGHGFRVILDYAHNPAGMAAIGHLVRGLRPRHGRCIGMVGCPGDRRDEDIRAVGATAAGAFDELVFRERPEQRGRPDGQVMSLLTEGALAAGLPRERVRLVADEFEALEACLRAARPGDLVVLTPASTEEAWRRILAFRPAPRPAPARLPDPAPSPLPPPALLPAPEMAHV
ncbi:MAG TPA: Mur ligase family protein, partial [Geminicoccaceae bacterium]